MTSFLDRLRGRDLKPTYKATTGGPWLASYASGGINLTGYGRTWHDRAKLYLAAYKVGWFYKAESRISSDFSTLAWTLSYEDSEGDNAEEIVAAAGNVPFERLDPLESFLRLSERPNPYQSGRAFKQKQQIRLDLTGRAITYVETGADGLPSAFYGISPCRMWESRDKRGVLIGWVMDKDSPGGGIPFSADEIIATELEGAEDDPQGVVESVYQYGGLTAMIPQHTADVLSTGGRLAGMAWPKDRALTEDEFADAQRAWRSVTSDPNAARRLLLFPEPMEYQQGASTPAEIGLPELATLSRDEILTAFPIAPEMLMVPMATGLNSGTTQEAVERRYWMGTIHPRVEVWEDSFQQALIPRYENAVGRPLDFDIEEPNLDDAATLIEKSEAYKGLISIGFDPKASVQAVGLDHIEWLGLPQLLDPAKQAEAAAAATEALANRPAGVQGGRGRPGDGDGDGIIDEGKAYKSRREQVVGEELPGFRAEMQTFLNDQRNRLAEQIAETLPPVKSQRKALPDDWWDQKREDAFLRDHLRGLYVRLSRSALTVVSNDTDRLVLPERIRRVTEKMLDAAGGRITGINETTRKAVADQVSEGIRRGYSVQQIVNGHTDEGFAGVKGATVFDEARAELVARTETMLAYNESAIRGYAEFGIRELEAIDGDDDDTCAERNGQVFSIEDALAVDEHPNGTLDWAPISDGKAFNLRLLDTMKAIAERPLPAPTPVALTVNGTPVSFKGSDVTVHVPEQQAPVVNVTTPETVVNVPEQAAPTVNVTNEVPAPVVNVTNDVPAALVQITNDIPAPVVHVEAPAVTVDAPVVNVAAAEAPVVNVTTPETVVNVSPTPITVNPAAVKAADVVVNVDSVRVTELPDRVHQVIRDENGKPTGSVESDIKE